MLALLKNALLNLLKVVMNQYGCMICMSVVGLCRLTCNMKNMKGFIITRFDWVVWRKPHRCNRNISMIFYNIIDLLMLDRRVLGWGYSGCIFLLFWLGYEEDKFCGMIDYFVALFCQYISRNYL
jgi:hypothetical protein